MSRGRPNPWSDGLVAKRPRAREPVERSLSTKLVEDRALYSSLGTTLLSVCSQRPSLPICLGSGPESGRTTGTQVIPFFAFPMAVRRIIYTTNAIESRHSEVRKAVRGRGHFPSDEAATK